MIVDKNSYIEIKNDVIKYSEDIVSKDEIDNLSQHIESKLADFKPTLMIYGTYNAGKSTLLNALFGQEEMAKTGDAPETKEVHEYEYNGYTIFDTPGLNARNEDDIVTTEHLEKSEVVLFVLSNNGSLEEDYVYSKISEVVKEKKPIIIVLNNKLGLDPNSREANDSMIKVGENLRKIGDRNNIQNIEKKVDICMVNAKAALKGKIEHKKLILKKSNILQLENMIEKLLEESGSKEVINALNNYIQNFIERVVSTIDNKIDNVEVQKTEEMITYLEKFRQNSSVKLKNIVSKKMPSFVDTLASILLNDNVSEKNINKYISDTITEINKQAISIYENIESDLSIKIDNFSQEFEKLDAEYEDISITSNNKDSDDESYFSDDIKNKIGSTLKDKRVLEEGAKQVLTKAKQWLPKEVMYGKGPAWIGKAAGKAAIGISVAIEAYGMYSANKEHQQMIEEKRNRTIGARNNAQSIADDIQYSLDNSIDEIINDTFNNLIIGFKDAAKKLNQDNSVLLSNKKSLISISNQLV